MSLPLIVFAMFAPTLGACGAGSAVAIDKAAAAPAATPQKGRVVVRIVGFRNHKGQALVSLFSGPKGFPDKGDIAHKRVARTLKADSLELTFEDVPPGKYAVAVLHDEDMDFKMKTGTFGIPKEGYGVSNNVKGRFGPPKFEDAAFKVKEGGGVELEIALIYH